VWQYLGLGSVAYVFVLALFVWLLLLPLRPKNWSYRNVLLFLALTAPPAVLYAIPVERFMTLNNARAANAWFLALVAAWRVALLVVFLRRTAKLSGGATAVATLLPISAIVLALSLLNLEHVVFNLMGGFRDQTESGNDTAYLIVSFLSIFAFLAAPVLAIIYFVLVLIAWRKPQVRTENS
jgi:hypothetical protein